MQAAPCNPDTPAREFGIVLLPCQELRVFCLQALIPGNFLSPCSSKCFFAALWIAMSLSWAARNCFEYVKTAPLEKVKNTLCILQRFSAARFHNSIRRKKQKTRYFSKATIAVFGKLGFSGSRKKRIARFAKRCVFVVSHSARLRISASPVSQLKWNSPHSPSQSAWYW